MGAQTDVPSELHPGGWQQHLFGLSEESCLRLAQRAFWVTGAGTGFGRAVSTALNLLGSRVVLTGRRESKLREAVSDAVQYGAVRDRFDVLPVDLTDAGAVGAAVSALRRASVSGLVHCAAIPQLPHDAPLLSSESLRSMLAGNVEAAWLACRAVVGAGAERGEIRIVLFTSEAAWHFTPGFGPYNISKAALNSLGGSLAAETAARHSSCDVQVNVLNPGEARSEMNQGSNRSPYTAVPVTLALLSHPNGGPNGRFFHADGRHLAFGSALPWPVPLLPAQSFTRPR